MKKSCQSIIMISVMRIARPFSLALAVLLIMAGSSLGAQKEKVKRKSHIHDGWESMLEPTTLPMAFVGAGIAKSRGGNGRDGGVSAYSIINPDPNSTGIVYSPYADNPNCDAAIGKLAENLGYDPIRIYEWVRNNIRTEFYFGCQRGAYLTFLERAGNDMDQCALLGALFRAANYTPTYWEEWTWIPRTATGSNQVGVYEWLGVNDDASAISLLHNFWPEFEADGMLRLVCMNVSITIPGRGEVWFVPSVKPHAIDWLSRHPGQTLPNLDAQTGYSWSAATAAAGASNASAYSPAISSSGLRSYLNTLAAAASSAIRSSATLHDLSGAELARLPVIQPEVVSVTAPSATCYPEGLLHTVGNGSYQPTPLSGIPDTYIGHIKLEVGTNTLWFEGPELLGQPLICEFDGSGTAITRLNGLEVDRESSGSPSQNIVITIGFELPVAFYGGISYVYEGSTTVLRQNAVAVPYGFGAMVGRLQKTLQDVSAKEAAAPSNVTLTDRLQIVGQQYMAQCHELSTLGSASLQHDYPRMFHGGFVCLRNGNPLVDIPVNLCAGVCFRSTSAPSKSTVLSAIDLLFGALEGTAIQQMSGQSAFGTPSLLDYAMTLNRDAYLLDSSNYSSTVGSLQNFNDTTLGAGAVSNIQNSINAGEKILLLGNSSVLCGGSIFGGYYQITTYGGVGSWISGARGGVSPYPTGSASVEQPTSAAQTTASQTIPAQAQTIGSDPVDLTTGAFLKSDTDLVVGNENEPNALRLDRNYNSARRLSDPVGLGRGWTHNYGLQLTMRSPNDLDMQRATVDEVLPVLIAVRLAQDAVATESTARAWLLASTALSWAVDQQINSRAALALGARSMEFVKQPGGTYAPPPGIAATLTKQSDNSHDLAFRHGNTIHFRAADGKFTSIVDQFNYSLTASYDGSNRLYLVADAYNRTFTFSYDGSGRLYQVADSTGRTVQYGREGTTFTYIDAENKTQRYEMDSDYCLTRVKDARNRTVIENDYDTWKRVWRQRVFGDTNRATNLWIAPGFSAEVDPLGYKVCTYFDTRGRKIFVVDQLNHLACWQYDGADRLVTYATPRGSVTTYDYDTNDVLVSETNPAGQSRSIVYDSQSRPTQVGNFEGQQTVYTYTTQHKVATVTAPGSLVTSYTYDGRGRIQTLHPAAYASGAVMTYAYDGYGNPQSITYPDSTTDSFTYNARGDLTQFIDRNNAKTTCAYNARRQRTHVIQWEGATQYDTQTVYDDAGDVDYTLDASGRKVDYDYDALGHLLTVKRGPISSQVTTLANAYDQRVLLWTSTDALGNTTTYGYDGAQRLWHVTDALNRTTTFGYDDDGHRTTVTTPLGFTTTDVYDARGFKDGTTDAENRTLDYVYDKDGRPTTVANRLNRSFTWSYTDTQRITTVTTPLNLPTTQTRNIRGLLETVTEPSNQTTTFSAYDSEGRLTQRTDGVGTTTFTYWPNGAPKEVVENSHTTYRSYDALNRLAQYQDGEGNTLGYQYLPSGELSQIAYPNGKGNVTYAYDDFGRLWTVTDWNNRVTAYTYNNASRLTRIDRPNGTYRLQEYDAAGQVRFIKDCRSNGVVLAFQELHYDDDGRIIYSFIHPKPAAVTLATDSLLYDDDNRLSTWNSQNVGCDADGNMTYGPLPGGSLAPYTYDTRNRLTNAGGSAYRYNPDGLRVEITGTGAATFVVDPNAALSRTLTRTKSGTTTYYVYGLGLLYEEAGSSTSTYHFNQIGSTLAMTDGSQNVTDRWSYAPFGAATRTTGSTDTPFLYNGELGVQTDANGLQYMRARYYNPRLMRFLNADPIGFGGGLNWYAFVENNPISNVDPEGLADVNLILPGDPAFTSGQVIPTGGPVFTVVVHGDKAGGFFADQGGIVSVSSSQIISAINAAGHKPGQPIQAMVCYGGVGSNLSEMKAIAKATGSTVVVATKAVAPQVGAKSGQFKGVTVGDQSGKGTWMQVNPDGKVSKTVTVPGVYGEAPAPAKTGPTNSVESGELPNPRK
ncbi:MAG: DUF6531 domain-containing protein [Opitutaceae bacterium]|nr:DUF6531 domain-containing protein [Opitutaceae bacterium]